ncbi:hypothetical protein N9N03_02560 [Chlamydiia bacterium]|nr:hypothetical protein [Chlamydiia bacterium]
MTTSTTPKPLGCFSLASSNGVDNPKNKYTLSENEFYNPKMDDSYTFKLRKHANILGFLFVDRIPEIMIDRALEVAYEKEIQRVQNRMVSVTTEEYKNRHNNTLRHSFDDVYTISRCNTPNQKQLVWKKKTIRNRLHYSKLFLLRYNGLIGCQYTKSQGNAPFYNAISGVYNMLNPNRKIDANKLQQRVFDISFKKHDYNTTRLKHVISDIHNNRLYLYTGDSKKQISGIWSQISTGSNNISLDTISEEYHDQLLHIIQSTPIITNIEIEHTVKLLDIHIQIFDVQVDKLGNECKLRTQFFGSDLSLDSQNICHPWTIIYLKRITYNHLSYHSPNPHVRTIMPKTESKYCSIC